MIEVVLDTETTGLSVAKGHRIVEIGCIELKNQIPTNKTFHCYLNPQRKVSEDAIKVHGYTDEFLADKKKFSETKVGAFLSKAAPGILGTVGDVLPDQGVLGMVKNLIQKEPETVLPPEDKEKAMKLLEMDIIEMQEVSKRWDSDMKSDSWLSKNTRPMSLIFLTVSMVILIILDSFQWNFTVDTGWVELLKTLLVTVYVAYFGSRGAEKFKSISNNK